MSPEQDSGSGLLELNFEKLVYGGFGLGRHHGQVVFVPFALPGDRALVRPLSRNRKFMRAEIVHILSPGGGRREPHCPYFGNCGGCHWQHLEYALQLESKRQILQEIFTHRFPYSQDLPISMKPSPEEYGYRMRARVQVRGSGKDSRVGFYRFQSHQVEDIAMCPLLSPLLNDALKEIRKSRPLAASESDAIELDIACSEIEQRWAVWNPAGEMADHPCPKHTPDKAQGDGPRLRVRVSQSEYTIVPEVFFQANGSILPDLLTWVVNLARDCGSGGALDLYCGMGLFTLPLARQFRQVTAVENSRTAVFLCEENAAAANIANLKTCCADVSQWMRTAGSLAPPGYDLVLLDPPRTGAGKDVMSLLKEWAPENIIYISCDPQTLCRDLSLLPQKDYQIDSIKGFDMFPQTYHFETVVRLRRR